MNKFATKPDISEPKLEQSWVCPVTGLVVPMEPIQNLLWRADLLEAAEKDAALQIDLVTACSQSPEFFVNAFCFTLRVFEARDGSAKQTADKHVPFILWPEQAKLFDRLITCIEEGEENLTDKSRDMGATWRKRAFVCPADRREVPACKQLSGDASAEMTSTCANKPV